MRRCLDENVRMIMEELQGQTVNKTPAMPTPGKAATKPGANAQAVAGAVQATADQSANTAAAAGDQKIQAQIAQQQNVDPNHAGQVNKTTAAQPQPGKISPTAQARDRRNDNLDGRKAAVNGKVVPAQEGAEEVKTPVVEDDKIDDKSAADDAANPDEESDFNDNPAKDRAAKRAKEIFPGAKKNDAAGYGKDGAGRPQGHHEVTHPGQVTKRTNEAMETVYTDAERSKVLDEVFGA